MRRLSLVMATVVLAASGIYALVYLFRWEWHRAIIAALFFVIAELSLGIATVLRRLARLEQRLDDLARRGASSAAPDIDPAILARIREAAPPAPTPFAWLDPRQQNLSVFLPFLLGVGALASGLAWVTEQLARHTTTPALERRLARHLAPLALPAGGLLGLQPEPVAPAARTRAARSLAIPIATATLVLGLAAAGTEWLADSLQTRPDLHREQISTRIGVELRGARSTRWPDQAAATLWGTCSHVLHGTVGDAAIRDVGGGKIEIIVPMYIGSNAESRVRGCLQDTVVDRVQATVLAVEAIPGD